jgi:hypothetical protein
MDMRVLSPEYKAERKWADHLRAFGAEITNFWAYTFTRPTAFLVCRQIKYRDNFFNFYTVHFCSIFLNNQQMH